MTPPPFTSRVNEKKMTDWLSPDAVPEQSELDKRDPRNPDDLENKRGKNMKPKVTGTWWRWGGGKSEASSDSSVESVRT